MLKLDKPLPVEQFEVTVSQSMYPPPLLSVLPASEIWGGPDVTVFLESQFLHLLCFAPISSGVQGCGV